MMIKKIKKKIIALNQSKVKQQLKIYKKLLEKILLMHHYLNRKIVKIKCKK